MAIYKMLGLSTAHISRLTARLMEMDCVDAVCISKAICGNTYGWYIPIDTELTDPEEYQNIPDDLRAVIRYALERGYDYLMFDEAEEVLDDLLVYD